MFAGSKMLFYTEFLSFWVILWTCVCDQANKVNDMWIYNQVIHILNVIEYIEYNSLRAFSLGLG